MREQQLQHGTGQSSGYDRHLRGAKLLKTVAVPEFVHPVQLTKTGSAVGIDELHSGRNIAGRLPEACEERLSIRKL